MKIANFDREKLHIFWKSWEISIKFQEKIWLMIMLKVTKNKVFTLSLEDLWVFSILLPSIGSLALVPYESLLSHV